MNKRIQAAIAKYGEQKCRDAYAYNCDGEGANTVGIFLNLTTRQADAAINAGRFLVTGKA